MGNFKYSHINCFLGKLAFALPTDASWIFNLYPACFFLPRYTKVPLLGSKKSRTPYEQITKNHKKTLKNHEKIQEDQNNYFCKQKIKEKHVRVFSSDLPLAKGL